MTTSEHNERKANTSANARKPLPLLAANTTNASRVRTTRENFTHTGEALSTCDVPRTVWVRSLCSLCSDAGAARVCVRSPMRSLAGGCAFARASFTPDHLKKMESRETPPLSPAVSASTNPPSAGQFNPAG